MTRKLVEFRKWRSRALKDPEFRKAYSEADEDPAVEIALQLIRLRQSRHLTQAQLARKLGTSQQAVARLESMRYDGYTLKVLQRAAEAFHKRLRIQFV